MEDHLKISEDQIAHFERNGFFLIPNPLGAKGVREVDNRQQKVEPEWARTEFPAGCNRFACLFLMLGEPVLQMVERPDLIEAARRILGVEKVHVGACGIGDASKVQRGGPRQVEWHADGSPEVRQVSFRTALDRHDASNGPLRVLPGSQHRPPEEVKAELLQLELATGTHDEMPAQFFARHPQEVEVILDPRWTLVWTPSCWHATGLKTAAGPRRAMGWNYYPASGRNRDLEALKHVHPDWPDWTETRQRLWGLVD
ncbi:MAG: phytanoyl-CoA dioxygenase family protein [Candidatus Latescibacteria bacterium]|nr:phytanoyl-CoA dioxygenase family protein [Candidatus Latescibacterota bacterium]